MGDLFPMSYKELKPHAEDGEAEMRGHQRAGGCSLSPFISEGEGFSHQGCCGFVQDEHAGSELRGATPEDGAH